MVARRENEEVARVEPEKVQAMAVGSAVCSDEAVGHDEKGRRLEPGARKAGGGKAESCRHVAIAGRSDLVQGSDRKPSGRKRMVDLQ